MEYLGLLIELLFLLMGGYLFLFSMGYLRSTDPAAREKAENFRRRNKWWLAPLSAVLVLLTAANLVLHLIQLLQN